MSNDYDFLSDSTEQTSTRFICFITPNMQRFDLAIVTTNRFYGKKIVIDLQKGISAIVGPDDLEEDGYLSHVFRIDEDDAEDLKNFLEEVVGPVNFTD